jgi:phosphoribosylanthranilate isomerase
MNTKLKICGITNRTDALETIACGVSILGFNFYPGSPRYLEAKKATLIIRELPFYIGSAGILVRPSEKDVLTFQKKTGCTAMQVYEPRDFDLFRKFPFPVIWAFRGIESVKNTDFKKIQKQDMVLIDTYSKDAYGGTGKTFSWDRIPQEIPRGQLVLAGGITTDNIRNALETVRPAIIDIAGGSESTPGKKDIKKIQKLVYLLHAFNMHELSKNEGRIQELTI